MGGSSVECERRGVVERSKVVSARVSFEPQSRETQIARVIVHVLRWCVAFGWPSSSLARLVLLQGARVCRSPGVRAQAA